MSPCSSSGVTDNVQMDLSYYISWRLVQLLAFLYFRLKVYNIENVPEKGAVILASNHISYLDPFFIGAKVKRKICYLCRDSAFEWFLIGKLLKKWNAIPLDREGRSPAGLKGILDRLENGEAVMLFPEGTRTRDGEIQSARPGIGLLVAQSGAPVVPIRIFGAWEAYNRFMRIPRPKPVKVVFGAPLRFDALLSGLKKCSRDEIKIVYKQISDEIMEAIKKIKPI